MIFVTGFCMLVVGCVLSYMNFFSDKWRFDAEAAFCAILLILVGVFAMTYSILKFAVLNLP